MSDTFYRVLCESPEYKKVQDAQPTKGFDFCEQKSLDSYFSLIWKTFTKGKSQLDLNLIYVTNYDKWKRR